MNNLRALLEREIECGDHDWSMVGDRLEVRFPHSRRKQIITFSADLDHYRFRSTILGNAEVTRTDREWRELARKVWRRNAHTPVVAFAFDENDRLIGQIEQPIRTLDREELVFYIETLARECDQFEYVLTGRDRE